jgi:hypothetical protein
MLLEHKVIYQWFYQHFHFYFALFLLNKTEELLYSYDLKRREILILIDALRMNIEYNTTAIVSGESKLLYYIETMKNVVLKFERLSNLEFIKSGIVVPRLTRGCRLSDGKIVLQDFSNLGTNFVQPNIGIDGKRIINSVRFQGQLEMDKVSIEKEQHEDKFEQLVSIIEDDIMQHNSTFSDWEVMGLLSEDVLKSETSLLGRFNSASLDYRLFVFALLSEGLSFAKVDRFMKMLNYAHMSSSTFYRVQSVLIPLIVIYAYRSCSKYFMKIEDGDCISFDACWDHRRHGGKLLGSMISLGSGKLLLSICLKRSHRYRRILWEIVA